MKYILFDLDGTLTDPKEGITKSVQYALSKLGIVENDLNKLETFIGPPLLDSFMQFYGMDVKRGEQAIAYYRERFSNIGIFENEVYQGIPELLDYLKKKGNQLAVASSKPTVYVERILDHFHIRDYFDVVVGSELDGRRTKKEDVIEEVLKVLFDGREYEKQKVYMVGDRKFDVEGAKNFGLQSVGVTFGYGGIKELQEAGAMYIAQTVEELKKIL